MGSETALQAVRPAGVLPGIAAEGHGFFFPDLIERIEVERVVFRLRKQLLCPHERKKQSRLKDAG